MLKGIVETIKKTIKPKLKKRDALFITKKVVGQASILRKSVRIQKISSKNSFLEALINKQVNTLQSIKELIMKVMIILTASIMQKRL